MICEGFPAAYVANGARNDAVAVLGTGNVTLDNSTHTIGTLAGATTGNVTVRSRRRA